MEGYAISHNEWCQNDENESNKSHRKNWWKKITEKLKFTEQWKKIDYGLIHEDNS